MLRLRPALFDELARQDEPKVGLLNALQAALQLEHATIPLYLYAQYSLDARNQAIIDLIDSVVMEEMLHMALVCNLINALGGRPLLADPRMLPHFPGPIPGGIHDDLVVHLAPFSTSQLDTFLAIEEPERPIEFHLLAAAEPPRTIGQFYKEILARITSLSASGAGLFSGDPALQVTRFVPGVVPVGDLPSARAAIETIVEQGEGTTQSPREAAGNDDDFAHYYRFASIAKGHMLAVNPRATPADPVEEQFGYIGDPIPFDPAGVFPVPIDPSLAAYPPRGPEAAAIRECNATYSRILRLLDAGFAGAQENIQLAIDSMRVLDAQATSLADGTRVPGVHLGPTFEFLDNP